MKKIVKQSFLLLAVAAVAISSCKKDEESAKTPPTVTVNSGATMGDKLIGQPSVTLAVTASAATGRSITTITVDRAVAGQATQTVKAWDVTKSTFAESYDDNISGLTVKVGDVITYTIKATDDKSVSATTTYAVTFKKNITWAVGVDGKIKEQILGAQSNSTINEKFIGIADNFKSYTAGATGTAKTNSHKVDIVYYFGSSGLNSFAAPSNTDGAQVIWNKEINGDAGATPPIAPWANKNATLFIKMSSILPADFDAIVDHSQNDLKFPTVADFSAAADKVTNLQTGEVVAYKTTGGKIGLIKIKNIATDNTGIMTFYMICQN